MARSNRSLACYDRDLKNIIGMNEAILFEWLWFFLHSMDIDRPNGRVNEGRRWALFSYAGLHLQSDLLGSQKTLTATIVSLEKMGLIIAVQSRDGKYYAIHFAKLKEIITAEHYQQYVGDSNVDGLDDWDLPFEKKKNEPKPQTTQNGLPKTTQNGESETHQDYPNPVGRLPKSSRQTTQNGESPIYKESITTQSPSIQKPLPVAKAPATKVSTKSAEYKALEVVVRARVYNHAPLDMQAGVMLQYLVIQKATPHDLERFTQWWHNKFPNAEVPRQIQRTAKTDNFQGKFVTRWGEWKLTLQPKPATAASNDPPIAALPVLSDSQIQTNLALLKQGKPTL